MEIETLGPLTGTVRATFSGLERTWDLEVRYFFQISQWKQRFEEFCHAPNLLLHLQQKVAACIEGICYVCICYAICYVCFEFQ